MDPKSNVKGKCTRSHHSTNSLGCKRKSLKLMNDTAVVSEISTFWSSEIAWCVEKSVSHQ